jgi:FtsZ-interacting cell division protein YlmF
MDGVYHPWVASFIIKQWIDHRSVYPMEAEHQSCRFSPRVSPVRGLGRGFVEERERGEEGLLRGRESTCSEKREREEQKREQEREREEQEKEQKREREEREREKEERAKEQERVRNDDKAITAAIAMPAAAAATAVIMRSMR